MEILSNNSKILSNIMNILTNIFYQKISNIMKIISNIMKIISKTQRLIPNSKTIVMACKWCWDMPFLVPGSTKLQADDGPNMILILVGIHTPIIQYRLLDDFLHGPNYLELSVQADRLRLKEWQTDRSHNDGGTRRAFGQNNAVMHLLGVCWSSVQSAFAASYS